MEMVALVLVGIAAVALIQHQRRAMQRLVRVRDAGQSRRSPRRRSR